jgi:hypothetical protein
VFVFVGEVAPQRVVRVEPADRLEGQGLQAPGLEGGMVVASVLDVDLQAVAQLAGVLVEGRLEPAFAQHAAGQPVRGEAAHFGEHGAGVDIRRAEQFERPRRAAPFGQRRAFEHHGAGIGAGHPQVGRVRAGVDPGPFAERPAVTGGGVGLPALHLTTW